MYTYIYTINLETFIVKMFMNHIVAPVVRGGSYENISRKSYRFEVNALSHRVGFLKLTLSLCQGI